jgi:hypothetical protein
MLAHGGAQIQIEQTKTALSQLGVEIDFLRWWDDRQEGQVLHHFGGLPVSLADLAHAKGWKVVNTVLFGQACNRSPGQQWFQKIATRTILAAPLPGRITASLPAGTYRKPDQIVVGLEAERRLLETVYGVGSHRITVVPLGLTEPFLKAGPGPRTQSHLICPGTIAPVKNSLELARLALQAEVPILFVGKPFAPTSSYWQQFQACIDGHWVKHHPHVATVQGMIDQYHLARGFVLMSRFENWCLAAHEAAACGLPLLLPDQPWARERFKNQAWYLPKASHAAVRMLREFYQLSPRLPAPTVHLHTWGEAAEVLRALYSRLLAQAG